MKKSLILGLLGLAVSVGTSFGQGQIWLDNYDSTTHPLVKYGELGAGGAIGGGVTGANGYTIGLFFVNQAGNFTGSFAADPTGTANPLSLYSGAGVLTLGTGAGSTGGIGGADTGTPGQYAPAQTFNPGLGEGATVTVMLIAYNQGSYGAATYRGHSTAFTMTTSTGSAFPNLSGNSETDGGFSVFSVPEPSVFALAGLGGAFLMLIRRKK